MQAHSETYLSGEDYSPYPRLKVVNTSGAGHKTKIFIDGRDVSSCFDDVQVSIPLRGGVGVKLNAVLAELEIEDAYVLELVGDDTRELLIKHGWVPPAERVRVPVVHKTRAPYEPLLDDELVPDGVPVSGRDLVDQFMERVQRDWQPGDGDTLTVTRLYDDNDDPIPGKRQYTLTVTMDQPS